MKIILLVIIMYATLSCDKNCDEDKKKLYDQYQQALNNAAQSEAAVNEVTRQYNEKLKKLDCD